MFAATILNILSTRTEVTTAKEDYKDINEAFQGLGVYLEEIKVVKN